MVLVVEVLVLREGKCARGNFPLGLRVDVWGVHTEGGGKEGRQEGLGGE